MLRPHNLLSQSRKWNIIIGEVFDKLQPALPYYLKGCLLQRGRIPQHFSVILMFAASMPKVKRALVATFPHLFALSDVRFHLKHKR